MNVLILVGVFLVVLAIAVVDYRRSPLCRWCNVRHRGRCIWNPRSGRIFANVNDGHFDYNDPNR